MPNTNNLAGAALAVAMAFGLVNTAKAACNGPGGGYPEMSVASSAQSTHEVTRGNRSARSLSAPTDKSMPKRKILRVEGLPDSFEITKTYGIEGARCGGRVTADIAFRIMKADLNAAFAANADAVIIDLGAGPSAKCPSFASVGSPHMTPEADPSNNSYYLVRNDGATGKDKESFLRIGDARAIKEARCFAIDLRKAGGPK